MRKPRRKSKVPRDKFGKFAPCPGNPAHHQSRIVKGLSNLNAAMRAERLREDSAVMASFGKRR